MNMAKATKLAATMGMMTAMTPGAKLRNLTTRLCKMRL